MNLFDPRHTPGPWSAIGGEILSQSMVGVGFVYSAQSEVTIGGSSPRTELEALANERLILSAPDLLAHVVAAAKRLDQVRSTLDTTPRAALVKLLDDIAGRLRTAAATAAVDPYLALVTAGKGGAN